MSIIPFTREGRTFRALDIDGQPWFVAADVASILGYSATAALTRTLDDDERGVHTLHTPGGDQEMTIVSESGLYSAILRSRVPGAAEFKRWVTHEVLPQIRRTGAYGAAPMTGPELMARAVLAADKTIKELQHKIDRDAPKVEAYDLFLDGTGCYQVATAANLLDIRVKKLWDWLYNRRYLIEKGSRRRQPRALAKTRGWFAVRTYATERTNGHASATTYITVLGLDRIRCELIADGLITSQLFALPDPKQVTA
ncbi:DNA-binding anti-repressor-like protein [Acidipropionibacterium acidipropionici ATCC 4875]|uniref:DNA-binding anti-repressor-like protein n=1 Tax=Acidipropionibacterium acidipropionici (strain ATCC 4875 / DSM 20272 / JCM 6432 / NBRC 12425 / NCIMB 8070 / 4) TaxID=1171373 RepID=K7SJF9_ACIA4|nr:phage antirepressor KilAC domain-containing protein [Acidipropionibacterium acidipropionici]AFV89395.1 DNA-binding anti-repressor-like protein [Acidipropionibacterium acidipropionici ATCC 4875]